MQYGRFTQDYNPSLIQQLLSETTTPLELCRRYNISSGQQSMWKQYPQGKLEPEPSREAEFADRVRELERLPGRLTPANEFLIKSYETASNKPRKRHFIAENRAFVKTVKSEEVEW